GHASCDVPTSMQADGFCSRHGKVEFQPTRATRYALRLPVRYRSVGDNRWHEGTTESISHSGVLFRAEDSPKPGTAIEMRFSLSAGSTALVVASYGFVVRTVSPISPDASPAVAATIVDFTFVRAEESL